MQSELRTESTNSWTRTSHQKNWDCRNGEHEGQAAWTRGTKIKASSCCLRRIKTPTLQTRLLHDKNRTETENGKCASEVAFRPYLFGRISQRLLRLDRIHLRSSLRQFLSSQNNATAPMMVFQTSPVEADVLSSTHFLVACEWKRSINVLIYWFRFCREEPGRHLHRQLREEYDQLEKDSRLQNVW